MKETSEEDKYEDEDYEQDAYDGDSSGANRRVNFDANNMSGSPENMFKSGDEIID